MRIWNEFEKDIVSHFPWFDKYKSYKIRDNIERLSVFSVIGSGLFGVDNKTKFIDLCSSEVKRVITKYEVMNDYNLYLFVVVEVKDKNSRIEKYKKVWKVVQAKWEIDGFNKGIEVEIETMGKVFFSSIAEFKLKDFSRALDIVSSSSEICAIIASKRENILSQESITDIFKMAFTQQQEYTDEIDYYNLSINLCPQGDMVFRWGDSSEESEIAIIFNRDAIGISNIY